MWLPLLVTIALLGQTVTRQAAPAGVVRGTVVKADNGGPLSRAAVRLTGPAGEAREATTDAVGRFEFTGVSRGAYLLAVTRGGYVNTVIEVKVEPTLDGLVVRMSKGAAIAGRIVDESGEPVVEARVQALRAQYVTGGRRLTAAKAATTNDLGEYRLYGLTPGTYFVLAGTTRFDLEGYDPEKRVNVTRGGPGFAPTFFPGSPVAADAQAIAVRTGTDAAGIDFMLRPIRLARLSGSVVDSRGRPATGVVVMLNMARAGGAVVTPTIGDMGFAEAAADGSFVLSNVKPGDYRLDVYPKAAMEAIARTGSAGRTPSDNMPEYGSVPLSVSGDDLDGLRIATTPGRRILGRVILDGATPGIDVLSRLKVSTVDHGAGPGVSAVLSSAPAVIRPDGTFEVRGVGGVRVFQVHGLQPGSAVKSIRHDGVDVTDSGVEVGDADVTDVELLLTTKPAGLAGTVTDASNQPAAAAVIVFPVDRDRWTSPPNRSFAAVETDADGSFALSPLPPGDYLVAVVDDLVDGEWGEPENLERLRGVATRVTLAEGERKTVTLRR